jgi:uncharacterized protein YfaT (DUF1175 family)
MVARRVRTAEPGDIVFWFYSEWIVHSVTNGLAVLRKPNDPDLTEGNAVRWVPLNKLDVWKKARYV